MHLDALLEGLILLLEASLGTGEGLADEGHEDAAEGLALNQPGAPAGRSQREAVLPAEDELAEDPGEPGEQSPVCARLGGQDPGADGDRAALGREHPQCEPAAGGDLPGTFPDMRIPLWVAAQVSQDRPDIHWRNVNVDCGSYRPQLLYRPSMLSMVGWAPGLRSVTVAGAHAMRIGSTPSPVRRPVLSMTATCTGGQDSRSRLS